MAASDPIKPDAFAALQARFGQQSRKAQAYYTVMHEVRGILGSIDAASAWMNEPQPALGGKTAAEAVGEGCEDEVLAYVRTLKK
ncbi:antitoxin Xre/MbcA/ParS toxin-binding domain-containing protein [Massilia alkalitolerans]|uniref:antitoxin Xre/MbcA/ParS toxin-binding domain-containing protein n=1 Tax=Massilia alkalitolerans TaxID=286638 RepID=UPI0028AE287C|nr:antitoxin Xre/MbcA/ParS toxin-binding domain-containing protein [Massilia alkalitolerans]